MKKILIIALSLCALGVQAQQSIPAIRGEVNTYFPTNGTKQIQAVKLRETFNDVLDHVDTLNKKKYGKTITQIRAINNNHYEIVYVLDSLKQGWFYYDNDDTSTADDGNNTIVAANGYRYKRSIILAPVVSVNGLTGVVTLTKDDIFGIDSIETKDIKGDAVTYAKIQNVVTNQRVLGRTSGAGGNVEELSLSQMMDWASSTQGTILYRDAATWSALGVGASGQMLTTGGAAANPSWSYPVPNGDKGDITTSANGATWTIDNSAVTYAKIQNISATQKVLGRNTAGAGVAEEVTASGVLDWIGSTRGQVLFRGASGWSVLSPGTAGQILSTGGAGADPSWVASSGSPFASDISANSVDIGKGGSSVSTNTRVGVTALNANTSGTESTAVGYQALRLNTIGVDNTAFGASALENAVSVHGNTAVGARALQAATAGFNTAIGRYSQRLLTSGSNNTSVGSSSLENNSSGGYNTAIGKSSLVAVTGSYNTAVGESGGLNVTSGTHNTLIGYYTGTGITTGGKNTIIGAQVTGLTSSLANYVILADGDGNRRINIPSTGNVLIATTTDAGYKLDVNGTARATQFFLSALNTAPASAGASGVTGEIRVDASYIYICTATNTWKRAAIATW